MLLSDLQINTMFQLPALPFEKDALAPAMSAETIEYHYGKHHKAYVDNLNNLVPGTPYEAKTLEEIITTVEPGPIFNNAAQAWNHVLFRNCLRAPRENNIPTGALLDTINQTFGSFDQFVELFTTAGMKVFGSGWVWLAKDAEGTLQIVATANGDNPLTKGWQPILGVDVREHSYYIDYRNARAAYMTAILSLINWDYVAEQFAK